MMKECEEEAGITSQLSSKCIPCGTVSYFMEVSRGLSPEVQFVFDLELPIEFTPVAEDGEVGAFYHLTIEEVKRKILTEEFKPNCALVTLDFLIRKGLVAPDEVADYEQLLARIRIDISSLEIFLGPQFRDFD